MITIGLSSYSMSRAINDGRMDIFQVMDFIKANGGKHIEMVPCGKLSMYKDGKIDEEFIDKIVQYSQKIELPVSSYTIGANFALDSDEDVRKEIERIKVEIDVAAKLGVKRMRHDAGWSNVATYSVYEKYLPKVVYAFQELADYAKPFGITTSLENHGYLFQGSERVQRVINAVARDNFRTTMDVGNFLCADECPVIAAQNNLPFASFIHFKDFYIRKNPACKDGYFRSMHGMWLKGAVTGEGDVDLVTITKLIKESDYDGFLSIEFEGSEDCVEACVRSLRNVNALFENN